MRYVLVMGMLISIFLIGCSSEEFLKEDVLDFDPYSCEGQNDYFELSYPLFFAETDFITWCEECMATEGFIEVSSIPSCNHKTTDAGKECTGSDECEGECLADLTEEESDALSQGKSVMTSGLCTENTYVFGCLPVVYNGEIPAIMCID